MKIGESFWNQVLVEHGLDKQGASFACFTRGEHLCAPLFGLWLQVYYGSDPLQLDRIGTYFEEVEPRAGLPARYVPRSLQVDLEGGVVRQVSLFLAKVIVARPKSTLICSSEAASLGSFFLLTLGYTER